MEQTRKNLKISSIVVLIFAGISLLQIVFALSFGNINAMIPEGASEGIILFTKILFYSVSFLLLLPNVYIGIKGLRIAKKPNSSKGHIVWGIILLVLTFLSLISPVAGFINNGFKYDYILEFLRIAVEVTAFFEYTKYAIALRKAIA